MKTNQKSEIRRVLFTIAAIAVVLAISTLGFAAAMSPLPPVAVHHHGKAVTTTSSSITDTSTTTIAPGCTYPWQITMLYNSKTVYIGTLVTLIGPWNDV